MLDGASLIISDRVKKDLHLSDIDGMQVYPAVYI